MNESECAYEAVGLEREFDEGQVRALRGVNLKIWNGEFVALIGPSGSGKSTLLQILGTLDQPTGGKLSCRGKDITNLKDSSSARFRADNLGFIFQSFHLLPTITAGENVQMPMFEKKWSKEKRLAKAKALLKGFGLEHRFDHPPSKMSGGERQRVAIARSLANEPEILLADEPTGNLDRKNAFLTMELLEQLHRDRNTTFVMVTHDLEIAKHADRIIHMLDGRIIKEEEGNGSGSRVGRNEPEIAKATAF